MLRSAFMTGFSLPACADFCRLTNLNLFPVHPSEEAQKPSSVQLL